MSNLIFDRKANGLARQALLTDQKRLTKAEVAEFVLLPARTSEILLRHDGLCFSVYGENCIVPVLLRAYGAQGLLELLEQGAIRFVLEKTVVLTFDSPASGVAPLAPGALSTEVHTNPAASVDIMLRRLKTPPPAPLLKKLAQNLADAYLDPSQDYAPHAVRLAHDGYLRGRFRDLGLAAGADLYNVPVDDRQVLGTIAGELHDLAILADLNLETLDDFVIGQLCDESFRKLVDARQVAEAAHRVFQIENVPSLQALFAHRVLGPGDVPKLRQHPDVVRFRGWLEQATSEADALDIGRRYVDAIGSGANFFETVGGRVLRTLGVSTLSSIAGAAVGGTVGAAAGVVVGPMIDLLDEFVLGSVAKGWQPRNYFENVVRPAMRTAKEKSTGDRAG
jgi:hypothetical protein